MKRAVKGFSIIELLIAIIIIGILVAIIIPRLATRSELARKRACESDLEEIRKAEEHSGIDTGYYYRLHVLDDNVGGDSIGVGQDDDINDGVRDEILNVVAENPRRMFINVSTGEILDDTSAIILYNRFTENETYFGWRGRYITWQKDIFGYDKNRDPTTGEIIPNDIPDDPWGRDYLFFTREGLVLEPDGEIVESCDIDVNGELQPAGPYDCKRFDRFVILSLGPNGLPGSQPDYEFGTGDDMIEQW